MSFGRDVTIIVKSFRRFHLLRRFLLSVRGNEPGTSIVIADDSLDKGEPLPQVARWCKSVPNVTWVQLHFDSGLSAGRNAAVKAAQTEFVLICDDDFEFTDETNIDAMSTILQEQNLDVVAGLVRAEDGRAKGWAGRIVDNLPQPLTNEWEFTSCGIPFRRTDLCCNFFLAEREALLAAPWDERFKVHEHYDHMLTMKAKGLKLAYTTASIVDHSAGGGMSFEYLIFRRRDEFTRLFKEKHGFEQPVVQTTYAPLPRKVRDEKHDVPNVIVMGVGHSGTTKITEILHDSWWNAGDANEKYAEAQAIRQANHELVMQREPLLLAGGDPDEIQLTDDAPSLLAKNPQPWAIKDPRFIHTLEDWLPHLLPYKPLLLWCRRDIEAVAASYQRKGVRRFRMGCPPAETYKIAQRQFELWPWRKLAIDFEDIACWTGEFDVARALRNGTEQSVGL